MKQGIDISNKINNIVREELDSVGEDMTKDEKEQVTSNIKSRISSETRTESIVDDETLDTRETQQKYDKVISDLQQSEGLFESI